MFPAQQLKTLAKMKLKSETIKTIYLTVHSHDYAPKNKLQVAVQELIKQNSRKAFDKSGIKKFKKQLVKDIEDLNKQHPRCTPIEPYFWKHTERAQAEHLYGLSATDFKIYQGELQEE